MLKTSHKWRGDQYHGQQPFPEGQTLDEGIDNNAWWVRGLYYAILPLYKMKISVGRN